MSKFYHTSNLFYFLFVFYVTSGLANKISAILTNPKMPKILKRATLLKEYEATPEMPKI